MKPIRITSSARGQVIVSNLIAAGIIATTAAGTASLVQYLTSQSRKSQSLNRAVVLQSEITAALLRKDQYAVGANAERDAIIARIKTGGAATGLEIKNAAGIVIGIVNTHYGYDVDGGPCAGAGCAIFVDVDVRCDTGTSACAAAYRVTPAPLAGAVAPPPLGAPVHNVAGGGAAPSCGGVPGFACADYSVPISYDYFMQSASPRCDGDDVMISGLDRTTGKLQCVKKAAPKNACPEGSIAHNVKAVVDPDLGTRRLELDCHPLARAACPPEYVFERLAVTGLDLGKQFTGVYGPYAPPNGMCRYRWRDDIDWQTPLPVRDSSGGSATATTVVCNANVYTATSPGGCGAAVTSSSPGTCYYSCNCVNSANGPVCQTCSSPSSSTATPSPIVINGAQVSCTINVTHSCNSTMTAHPVATGKCRVKPPFLGNLERAPAWQP